MYVTVATLLALQCTLSYAIRVPVAWNGENSAVNKHNQFQFNQFGHQNVASSNQKPIPTDYFQYTAQKPKFAVDVAKIHGVQSPENHYTSYPIKPHTGVPKPELGKHQLPNNEEDIFAPYQESGTKNEAIRIVSPASTSYEVFHPYKLEEPALKELYRDPVMEKIRSDLENNKNRLQKYEIEAGKPDITKEEYLDSPEEIDRKKVPHKNVPATYEIHRPQRRPVYYRPPFPQNQKEKVVNQKLRHPWHQNHVKVTPVHYRPVKNHLQRLRQQHALKYDDERNEYPQLPIPEKHSEPPEGYDIYEKGKEKFLKFRNNIDESLNKVAQKNEPPEKQKLELSDDDYDEDINSHSEEDEFVPIKNYAQVRKTETTKHLPKEAAYHDADTLEEIQNAPRLREAVKSSKAQTVYSEEGYEDTAYDHAGEQKHASDHEEHSGVLKQKEKSKGKFKLPTVSDKYENEKRSESGDLVLDGKTWEDSKKNTDEEIDLEEYSDNDEENSDESDTYNPESNNHKNYDDEDEVEVSNVSQDKQAKRIKREPKSTVVTNFENMSNSSKSNGSKDEVVIEKMEIEHPETQLNTKISKLGVQGRENNNDKYPYYYIQLQGINKDSPLRYAENLKFIPKKSEGGTEFYESRAAIQCPEVEDDIDPIPEKFKKDGHPDDDEEDEYDDAEDRKEKKDKNISDALIQMPRLNGLGDKIDCFKTKYFGNDPLDSPFFKEEIISNPEPMIIPSIDIYRLKQAKQQSAQKTNLNDPNLQQNVTSDTSSKTKVSNDLLVSVGSDNVLKSQANLEGNQNTTVPDLQEKQGIKYLINVRKKRAAPFVYEPYKIIRDSQIQDSKKTTTTNNISPLIKQLQSSRVVDKVTTNTGKDQIVKRSASTRTYKDIGKNDRDKNVESKGSQPPYDASFVDVSVDQRRGEPRYELRSPNHKRQHTPEQNKRSMTVDDYKAQTKTTDQQGDKLQSKRKPNRRRRTTTIRPYFDVSKFLPQEEALKNDPVKSNSEMQTNQPTISQSDKSAESTKADDAKNYFFKTTTTTVKTPSRRKTIDTPTTLKPDTEEELSLGELPKLRLITRFQDSYQTEKPVISQLTDKPALGYQDDEKIKVPKYREKKKKISKSTLVTDTNSYGEDDDDDLNKEEEVDGLIGVKHDIEEYLPTYEREAGKKDTSSDSPTENQESDEDFEEDSHRFGDEDEESDDEDEENDDDEDEDEDVEDDEESEIEEELKPEVTTPEPTKRTLMKTTEAPLTTTEARSAKLEIEPVVVKKKLDIHKELPVNRSSPHITEFKQDIKEVEIIKEIPSRKTKKPQKHIEALELYKDENLAKDINKLGGVEVFKEGLDLVNGPKHGGNYRIAETLTTDDAISSSSLGEKKENSSIGDVVASPSKTSKIIETQNDAYSRRRSDIQRARNSRNRSAKLIELSDATEKPTSRPMHGGNFRSIHDMRRRGGTRNAKLIELVDQPNKDDHSTTKHDSNSRSYGSRGGGRHQMHGGNYRSAKLVKADDKAHTQTETIPKKDSSTDVRQNSANLLNSFARAVSVLSTPPTPYISDPSKRMYYYVEA